MSSPSSWLSNHFDRASSPSTLRSIAPSTPSFRVPDYSSASARVASQSTSSGASSSSQHETPDNSLHLTATTTTTVATSTSPQGSISSPPVTTFEDNVDLEASLRTKRLEIDQEIEAFRLRKEAEFTEFETTLRAEAKAKMNQPRESEADRGDGSCDNEAASTAQSAPPAGSTRQGIGGGGGGGGGDGDDGSSAGVQVPLDLGGPRLGLGEDLLVTLQQPAARETEVDNHHYYPPFEKELQVAGLFAPNFLPLLDSRYHTSPPAPLPPPPASPKMVDSTTATDDKQNTAGDPRGMDMEQKSLPKPTSISRSRNSSKDSGIPNFPLASSLKSTTSINSINSPGDDSDRIPPKSPRKRVTFHFEDDSYVPSRSSPPKNKVVWKLGIADNKDDGFEDDVDDDENEGEEGEGHAAQIENVAGSSRDVYYQSQNTDDDRRRVENIAKTRSPDSSSSSSSKPPLGIQILPPPGSVDNVGERYQGDELVTPSQQLLASPAAADVDVELKLGPETLGSVSPGTGNMITSSDNKVSSDKGTSGSLLSMARMNAMHGDNDDDGDDGLFDLDETIPDEPVASPPHRDLSPLAAATALADLPSQLSLPASQSASYGPLSIKTTPRTTTLSLEPLTFGKSPVTTSNSAVKSGSYTPSTLSASFSNPSISAPPRPNPPIASSLPAATTFTRFRRRSINKYIPSPPPEESDEAPSATTSSTSPSASPYASSLPMSITPRLNTLRSPPASTSPAPPKPSTSASTPAVSGRAEPDTRQSKFAIDTAGLLAQSPPTTTSRPGDEIDSYRKTDRFFSGTKTAGLMSPYRTDFAREVAEMAMRDGDAGLAESVVGGVDGGTGLDPGSFSMRAGSVMHNLGGRRNSKGGGGFSLSQRMAMEDAVEAGKLGSTA